jgi:hypothetical protein
VTAARRTPAVQLRTPTVARDVESVLAVRPQATPLMNNSLRVDVTVVSLGVTQMFQVGTVRAIAIAKSPVSFSAAFARRVGSQRCCGGGECG